MTYFRLPLLLLSVLAVIWLAGKAEARPAPALSEARSAPTFLALVPADRRAARPLQCPYGAFYSDVQAYRWDGSPAGAQHWHERGADLYYWWRVPGGRVTFDGLTFDNQSAGPVLVAGWCETGRQ